MTGNDEQARKSSVMLHGFRRVSGLKDDTLLHRFHVYIALRDE